MLRYLKSAFLFHWNLLYVAAGTAFGFLSGRPDVVLPLLGAAEVIYLAGLSAHPRFQKAVDAKALAARQPQNTLPPGQVLEKMLTSLDVRDHARFLELRNLCRKLNEIGREVKGATDDTEDPASRLQRQALNRLLWVWLKILYAKNALQRYFDTVDELAVREKIAQITERLSIMDQEKAEEKLRQKYRKSLSETLSAYQKRLATMEAARANLEFLEIEQERLRAKISSLAELGVGGHDTEDISTEIDVVSQSAESAERLITELELFPGTMENDVTPPALLTREIPARLQAVKRK